MGSFLVVEDSSVTKDVRHDLQARSTVKGALELLKRQMDRNGVLKYELWGAINSKRVSLYDKRRLLDVSSAVFPTKDSYVVDLKTPKLMRLRAIRGQRFNIVIKRQFAFDNRNGTAGMNSGAAESGSRPLPKISFVAKKITSPSKHGGHGIKPEATSAATIKKQKSHKIKLTAGGAAATGSAPAAGTVQPAIPKIKLSTHTSGVPSGAGVTKRKKSGSSGNLPAAVKLNPELLTKSVAVETPVASTGGSSTTGLAVDNPRTGASASTSGTASSTAPNELSSSETNPSQPALPKVKLKLRLN
ncbi:hypothetical protein D0Z00_000990 [Geotrichum galactomycetum]|uniref:Uncharacterized protein n=1 Tax=Geotrichum galactomycetum TaxID=27317 RepID=A0ACB6V872_9ASCO|nr:hypothetical protein D0Z00_000990 [Geotrichum candidum]